MSETARQKNTKKIELPARMNPLPDELLSSWLMRLAMAHGMKVHSLCSVIFGDKTKIWNRDIDKSVKSSTLEILSSRTEVRLLRVIQTTLADYEGIIYEDHNPNGNTAWIMPLGIFHRQHQAFGLQMCPFCLSSDEEPYYRRRWRLSWITLCTEHRVVLLDKCPDCEEPINFYRSELGQRNLYTAKSMTTCSFCGIEWTSNKIRQSCRSAEGDVVEFQTKLENAISNGWIDILNESVIYPIGFFNGCHHLLLLIGAGNRGARFRRELSRLSGIELQTKVEARTFDHLSVDDRYQAMRALAWLLEDWSDRFVEVAINSRTWASSFLSDDDGILPFWYKSVISENLIRENFGVSEEEIHSALFILQSRDEYINLTKVRNLMQSRDILKSKLPEVKINVLKKMRDFNDQLFQQSCIRSSRRKELIERRKQEKKDFNKIQNRIKRSLEIAHVEKRLRWVKHYEKRRSFRKAAASMNVSVSILRKWYHRYKKSGIAGLVEQPRKQNIGRKTYPWLEKRIVKYHLAGLNVTYISNALKNDYDVSLSRQTIKSILLRTNRTPVNGWKHRNKMI